jgi:bifunctional DNA-binding transcriptional regulator/antitoxin component of YhaV-PrlF toxin-antitoxin module
MIATIVLLAIGFALGFLIAEGIKRLVTKKPKVLRRGTIIIPIDYWSRREWKKANVLVILHEIDRVADQSKVIIEHIDDAPNEDVVNSVTGRINDYIETDKVNWDEPNKRSDDIHKELDHYIQRLEEEQLVRKESADIEETIYE